MRFSLPPILLACAMLAGCGTTRWSDTQRTATEQLLISDAIDRAVSELDFDTVAGKKVYLDTTPIKQTVDAGYLISTLRQHLLAAGCVVKDKPEEADYTVEVRAGAVGTDRRDLLFGVPAAKIPAVGPMAGAPSSIPEIPLATKTEQHGVAKIAVFVYNRRTGHPVWQSGVIPMESKIKDIWVFGVGPFQRGSIYKGTRFAGQKVKIPLAPSGKKPEDIPPGPSVAKEAYFVEPDVSLAERDARPGPADSPSDSSGGTSQRAVPASYTAPAPPPAADSAPPPPGPSGMSAPKPSGRSIDLTIFGARYLKPETEKAKTVAETWQ